MSKLIQRTCPCGRQFQVYEHRAKSGRGKFCSLECRAKYQKRVEYPTCPVCGKVVKRPNNKYCSRLCAFSNGESFAKHYNNHKSYYTHAVDEDGTMYQLTVVQVPPYQDLWEGHGMDPQYLPVR